MGNTGKTCDEEKPNEAFHKVIRHFLTRDKRNGDEGDKDRALRRERSGKG